MNLQDNKIYSMRFYNEKLRIFEVSLYLIKIKNGAAICTSIEGRTTKHITNVLFSTMTYVGSRQETPEYFL